MKLWHDKGEAIPVCEDLVLKRPDGRVCVGFYFDGSFYDATTGEDILSCRWAWLDEIVRAAEAATYPPAVKNGGAVCHQDTL